MYIWNTKALAKDFSDGRVDQKQRLYFFLGILFVFAIDQWIDCFLGGQPKNTALTILCDFTFLSLGTLWCYLENRKVDNREFLDRLIAFGFANAIRVHIFAYVFIFSLVFLLAGVVRIFPSTAELISAHSSLDPISRDLLNKSIDLPIWIFAFYLIRSNISRIAHSKV